MSRSSIEMMVDHRSNYKPDLVTLRCPKCERTKRVLRDETGLPGTAVVEAICDKCDPGADRAEVFYFDAQGKQIMFSEDNT